MTRTAFYKIGVRNLRQFKILIMAFVLVLSVLLPFHTKEASAAVSSEAAYANTGKYMVETTSNPTFGNEWFIIALARGNYPVPTGYYEKYYNNLVKEVKALKGELHSRKYTEYSRVILALSAIGKDATNVGGYNLVEKLYNFDNVKWQGINGPIFALIALDTWQYDIPTTASNSRDKMIGFILSKQLEDGGFALSGTKADPDITGMAIQALSTYKGRSDVSKSIAKALQTLGQIQVGNGGYESLGNANSESIAQVITAITSLSIDPTKDTRFNKVLPQFLNYYSSKDGGFKHILTEMNANGMATEQAAYTLAALHRFQSGQTKLYDMSDTKNSFSDIADSWAKDLIKEAIQLKLIKGFSDGTFKPNQELTRIQATSLITRALDLQAKNPAPFKDVSQYGAETRVEVAAAYEAGIIKGQNGEFNPSNKVTRAQLALMLARAHTYKTGQVYIPQKIAPFKDIANYNLEAKNAMTMLYDYNIASGANGNYMPNSYTTRAHAAKMLVNFYKIIQ